MPAAPKPIPFTSGRISIHSKSTANEVRLHLDVREHTALAIVSGMSFVRRGDKPVCAGGELEYRDPSAIDGWEVEPTAFIVRRKT